MIDVRDIRFSYTKQPFLEDISFTVGRGEVFGFLGPSGAGKTTLQKILTGQITGYGGSAKIAGEEAKAHGGDFYERIGVDFEFPTLYEKLTARENLAFFGSLYKKKPQDADALLDAVELKQDVDKKVGAYSKGMKTRLNFIKALLHDPEVLFLDEPTSGLDPGTARLLKDMIKAQRAAGKTIILTTHNMHDATELCDRVAFIVDGHVKALDAPHALILSRGAARLNYSYTENGREQTKTCLLSETAQEETLHALLKRNALLTAHTSEPTLEDIFLEVTGRALS